MMDLVDVFDKATINDVDPMVRIVKISWDDSIPLTVEEISNDGKVVGDAIPNYLEPKAAEQNAVV